MQFYKPNPRNTGHCGSFQLSPDNKCVFLTIIKQSGWNDAKKLGSFSENRKDPTKSVNIKFNEIELGGFLDAICRNIEYSMFHKFENSSCSIKFSPYYKNNKPEEGQIGFSLRVSKGENSFSLGLTYPETMTLNEYLKFALQQMFAANAYKKEVEQ